MRCETADMAFPRAAGYELAGVWVRRRRVSLLEERFVAVFLAGECRGQECKMF